MHVPSSDSRLLSLHYRTQTRMAAQTERSPSKCLRRPRHLESSTTAVLQLPQSLERVVAPPKDSEVEWTKTHT